MDMGMGRPALADRGRRAGRAEPPAALEGALALAQAGDAAAFTRLAAWCEAEAWALAAAMGLDEATAADLWQDTLLAAWRCLAAFGGDAARFRGWVMRVHVNHCREALGREARRRRALAPEVAATEPVAEGDETPLEAVPDGEVAMEQRMEDLDFEDLLQEAIRAVPEPQRTALFLFCCDYAYDEIAFLTGVGASTVAWRIRSARHHAQAFLQRQAGIRPAGLAGRRPAPGRPWEVVG